MKIPSNKVLLPSIDGHEVYSHRHVPRGTAIIGSDPARIHQEPFIALHPLDYYTTLYKEEPLRHLNITIQWLEREAQYALNNIIRDLEYANSQEIQAL